MTPTHHTPKPLDRDVFIGTVNGYDMYRDDTFRDVWIVYAGVNGLVWNSMTAINNDVIILPRSDRDALVAAVVMLGLERYMQ